MRNLQCQAAAWAAIWAFSPPRSRHRRWSSYARDDNGTGGRHDLASGIFPRSLRVQRVSVRRRRRGKVGLPLTVLTALTRLGFDPWREAARLSDLPRETAARAFAVTIAMLPEGDWKASESEAIAARLVNWLPGRSALAIPSMEAAPIGGEKMKSGFATWL